MSAYVVDKKHIDALCKFAKKHKLQFRWQDDFAGTERSINRIGQILVDENYRSVNYRYSQNEQPYQYNFDPNVKTRLTPIQIYKACDCYDYQACEMDDYRKTFAAFIIETIRNQAIRSAGYVKAKWQITE